MGFEKCFFLFLFFLLAGLASPSPVHVKSDGVLKALVRTGHGFPQPGDCPIDFEKQNYTILTSQCKGPFYNATTCCPAFKKLACPYQDELNNEQNGCAAKMLNYINFYGQYPIGLFGDLCRDDERGINCSITQPDSKPEEQKGIAAKATQSSVVFMLIATFLFNI